MNRLTNAAKYAAVIMSLIVTVTMMSGCKKNNIDASSKLNKSDIESPDTEDDDDELPEGFEIEDHYETVEKIKTETGSKYAFTTENVQEDIDESENMSVEEVEAAFEIEETEQEEENISADEVPLFKQRDRE